MSFPKDILIHIILPMRREMMYYGRYDDKIEKLRDEMIPLEQERRYYCMGLLYHLKKNEEFLLSIKVSAYKREIEILEDKKNNLLCDFS
jgi:hypothetical protein